MADAKTNRQDWVFKITAHVKNLADGQQDERADRQSRHQPEARKHISPKSFHSRCPTWLLDQKRHDINSIKRDTAIIGDTNLECMKPWCAITWML